MVDVFLHLPPHINVSGSNIGDQRKERYSKDNAFCAGHHPTPASVRRKRAQRLSGFLEPKGFTWVPSFGSPSVFVDNPPHRGQVQIVMVERFRWTRTFGSPSVCDASHTRQDKALIREVASCRKDTIDAVKASSTCTS